MVIVYDRFVFYRQADAADSPHARARAHRGPPCRREPTRHCRLDSTPPPARPGSATTPTLPTKPPLLPQPTLCCVCSLAALLLVDLDLERRLERVQVAAPSRRVLFLPYEDSL